MIGVSLSFNELVKGSGRFGERNLFLDKLKAQGVTSIELRNVKPDANPDEVASLVRFLWRRDFNVTVHSCVKSAETAIDDVFKPLFPLLYANDTRFLMLTVHPIQGDNAPWLLRLSDFLYTHRFPAAIALENKRLMPDGSEGDCTEFVYETVARVNRKNIGICFDFGHYRYHCLKNHPEDPDRLPSSDFLRRVIHTHIHGVNGLETHQPLRGFSPFLNDYLAELSRQYYGVYNLELEPKRWDNVIPCEEGILDSVSVLSQNLPLCARLYENERAHFGEWLQRAFSIREQTEGTHFSLLKSSSYLFNTDGYFWAMDLSLRTYWAIPDAVQLARNALKGLKLVIVTHAHSDHFERALVPMLRSVGVHWLIPKFMKERAERFGLTPAEYTLSSPGEALKFGPLTVLPFEGRHYRKNMDGVEAYGYFITSPHGPSLVFPSDVRNYSLENLPILPKADYCFSHLWLRDHPGNKEIRESDVTAFSDFMSYFSDKHWFITHLYESSRRNEDIWCREHAALVEADVKTRYPGIATDVPENGDVFRLS